MTNHRVVEEYWEAFKNRDLDRYEELLHSDVVVTYPQSGEVIVGRDNYMQTIRNYPLELPSGADEATFDMSEKAISMPSAAWFGMSSATVISEGDIGVGQVELTYPSGERYLVCSLFKFKQGLIAAETTYFASPFEAPEWRSEWVSSNRPTSG